MPDIRYAVLAVLGAGLLARWLWKRFARRAAPPVTVPADPGVRVLMALGSALILAWVLWLRTSGNGRYLLPMGSVAAVLIAAILYRGLAEWPRVRLFAFASILSVQLLQVSIGAEYRWDPRPWGGGWLDIDVPEKLASESNLYFVIGMQSNSFIAPYLARGSGLIDFSGGYPLSPDGPGGVRVEELIRSYQPRLRMLIAGSRLYADGERRAPTQTQLDRLLGRFELRVDSSDCATITVVGVTPDLEITVGSAHKAEPSAPVRRLLSCHLVPGTRDRAAELAQQRTVDRVFDRLEDACPQLFQPRRVLSEPIGGAWRRNYINTDLQVHISGDYVRLFDPSHGDDPSLLGRTSEWLADPPALVCGRSNGHFYARLTARGQQR